MARPRVFVSSTYYDLKHLRSSLEHFIESLGYDAVLSEKGGVAYTPELPLDESCYRELKNCDIYVLIIGGRYGSEASQKKNLSHKQEGKDFYERYESVTKQEYKTAVENDIPIYILIDRSVHVELDTYRRNKDKTDIEYAHVDSVNIFNFIEEILAQPRNNPIQPFDRYSDIESWLKEQWAGIFRELLKRQSSQQQISSLASQVQALSEINVTLKRYLEEMIKKLVPVDGEKLISSESARLEEAQRDEALRQNNFVSFMTGVWEISFEQIRSLLMQAKSAREFMASLPDDAAKNISDIISLDAGARREINAARQLLNLPPWFSEEEKKTNKLVIDIGPRQRSSKAK